MLTTKNLSCDMGDESILSYVICSQEEYDRWADQLVYYDYKHKCFVPSDKILNNITLCDMATEDRYRHYFFTIEEFDAYSDYCGLKTFKSASMTLHGDAVVVFGHFGCPERLGI